MRKVILLHVAEAPEEFRPLLRGLLRRKPEKRWTARKCLKRLWKITQADAGISEEETGAEEGTASEVPTEVAGTTYVQRSVANCKKRLASRLGEEDLPSKVLRRQTPRSYNSSVSLSRAEGRSPAFDAETSLPDTLPWGDPLLVSPSPLVSSAPTPQNDDDADNPGEVEDEEKSTDGSDTEFENDWGEDDD